MAKFFQTNEFKELSDQWQQKLAESGFVDIENRLGDLKQNAPNSYRQADKLIIEAKLKYFQLISRFLQEDESLSKLELTVMRMRSDGLQIIQIAKENNIDRHTVTFIIRRCEHAWGIRVWSKEQRNIKHEPF